MFSTQTALLLMYADPLIQLNTKISGCWQVRKRNVNFDGHRRVNKVTAKWPPQI